MQVFVQQPDPVIAATPLLGRRDLEPGRAAMPDPIGIRSSDHPTGRLLP